MNRTSVSVLLATLLVPSLASAAPEKLEKRLLGKKVLSCEVVVKEGDKHDPEIDVPETYINCRDRHHYFLESYPPPSGPFSSTSPRPKSQKVYHGLRIVQDLKGELVLLENYYAGEKHGPFVKFDNGRRWYEISYHYGKRHGMARHYHGNGQIHIEEEYVDGVLITARYFHDNGQPSYMRVRGILQEERDDMGQLLKTRAVEMRKLHGNWEIISATKDGKTRDAEKGGTLTFVGDEVHVTIPGKKMEVKMSAELSSPGKNPFIRFQPKDREAFLKDEWIECGGGRFAIEGDLLKMSFSAAGVWPKNFSDKDQIVWTLKKKRAPVRKD